MSDGVETTVSLDGVTDSVEIQLVGENSITTPINSYDELGAKVLKNGSETDHKPSITYTNNATNSPVDIGTMNSTPGSYTVTYTYDGKTATRTVTIQ